MKKKGFTLVELLGVIVILAIVLGIAVVGYLGLNGEISKVYYRSVEESMVIPGSDYFNYNKGEQPNIFGDEVKVSAKVLQDGGYIENELLDSDGNSCDLENSYVGAYKDSKDKTNYYTCLVCGDYKSDSLPCTGGVSYSLGIKANGKNTNNVYDIKVGKWINENIVLTFETLNDMTNVILEDSSDRQVGSCELKTKNKVKTCTIEVTTSDNYQAYATKGSVTTRKEDVKIQIDKTNPTFDIANTGNSNKIELDLGNNINIAVNNEVLNINDPESKVKTIEYSFEKSGQKAKYQTVSLSNSFKVNKTLGLGTYELIVRVTNNAGGSTTQKVVYELYKKIAKPTAEKYCQTDLEYNGIKQMITKSAPEGITFSNNTAIDAGKYIVTAKLKNNYRYKDNTTNDINFECQIAKKKTEVKWNVGEYIYNGNKQGPTGTAPGVENEILKLTTTKETNAGNYTSNATLTSVTGGQKNVGNYELSNTSVNYTIKKADPELVLSSYNGEVKSAGTVDVTASTKVTGTFTNTASNTNASVAPSSASGTGETITITGKVSGNCDITVKFVPSNNNYETVSKTYKLTVTTVKYTINYWQMNNDGENYTLVKTVTGEGNVGSNITGEVINYENFQAPDPITITLDSDASKNVIDYYYDKACFGATCDFCKRGSKIGQCFYEHREELGLWESGLKADTNNENVRYTGTKTATPNNYICFGSSCTNRIIGVFGTSHQLRIITSNKWSSAWSSSSAVLYPSSTLVSNVTKKGSALYSKTYIRDNISYETLVDNTYHSNWQTKGKTGSNSATERRVWTYDATTILTRESETGMHYKYWPVSLSDILLSNKVKGNFRDNAGTIKNNWLHIGSEFSYHMWNGNNAYYMGKGGGLCGCTGDCADGWGTTPCSTKYSGWYTHSWNYRVNSTLKDSVLFCGGSGTKADPYKVGWEKCTN